MVLQLAFHMSIPLILEVITHFSQPFCQLVDSKMYVELESFHNDLKICSDLLSGTRLCKSFMKEIFFRQMISDNDIILQDLPRVRHLLYTVC